MLKTAEKETLSEGDGRPQPPVDTAKHRRQSKYRPAGLPTGVDYWDWQSQFSSDDWQHLIAYIWRTFPSVDRRTAGKPLSIGKYTQRFDLERIKLDHGSGGYRVDLVQVDPASTKQTRIAQHYFNILDLDFPPRVPYGEWLSDPENEAWRWAEPKLKAVRDAAAQQAAQATPPPDQTSMFKTVLDGVRTLRGEQQDNSNLTSAMIGLLQDKQEKLNAALDPATQLATIKNLLDTLRPQVEPENKTMNMLLAMLIEDRKQAQSELAQIREQMTERKSFLSELREGLPEFREIASSLGLRRTGEPATDWGGVLAEAVSKLAEHIPTIIEAMSQRQPQQQRWAGWPQQPTIAPPQPATGATPMDQNFVFALQKHQHLIAYAMPFLLDHFVRDLGGHEFRDWFLDARGRIAWAELRKELGPDGIVRLIRQSPELAKTFSPPEKLERFMADFFSDQDQNDQDDEDSRPPTVALPQ